MITIERCLELAINSQSHWGLNGFIFPVAKAPVCTVHSRENVYPNLFNNNTSLPFAPAVKSGSSWEQAVLAALLWEGTVISQLKICICYVLRWSSDLINSKIKYGSFVCGLQRIIKVHPSLCPHHCDTSFHWCLQHWPSGDYTCRIWRSFTIPEEEYPFLRLCGNAVNTATSLITCCSLSFHTPQHLGPSCCGVCYETLSSILTYCPVLFPLLSFVAHSVLSRLVGHKRGDRSALPYGRLFLELTPA